MSRLLPLCALLLGGTLTLGACSNLSHVDPVGPQESRVYLCDGANTKVNFAECDKEPHSAPLFQPGHSTGFGSGRQ
jgi:hypothetical protein